MIAKTYPLQSLRLAPNSLSAASMLRHMVALAWQNAKASIYCTQAAAIAGMVRTLQTCRRALNSIYDQARPRRL